MSVKERKRTQREGVLVSPYERLSRSQVELIDEISRTLLEDPGLLCYNPQATKIFREAGAKVEDAEGCARVRVPARIVDDTLKSAPSTIILGARDPDNKLILDAHEPRVRFVSGAETNIWLSVDFEDGFPRYTREPGSVARLCASAHLCDNLENLDAFIRNVNIRDEAIVADNKDVNKFAASLNNITKHVQAGLTSLDALDDVIRIGQIAAGGKDAFEKNPVFSFITCVVKSPLQIVNDTAAKLIAISSRRAPVVISSSPMGGTTAPFEEFGMVAQINAEILAGVALNQLVSPGAPVLYGSVPVRTRLDNLNDMYGAPEFNHYHHDAAQMARHYGLPCYSTAGVGDAEVPGIQATAEKMLTHGYVPWSGAQYIHYAFGLLDRTSIFCPEQAVLDDAHIGMIKYNLRPPDITPDRREEILDLVREVMKTDHRTYIYHLPLPTKEKVYVRYPLENEEGGALLAAHNRYEEIMAMPRKHMPGEVREQIEREVTGLLPETLA
jgi:trimethylamine--corrinoid protein Co-methyltransferase